jgi:hypothetical protein
VATDALVSLGRDRVQGAAQQACLMRLNSHQLRDATSIGSKPSARRSRGLRSAGDCGPAEKSAGPRAARFH